MVRVVSQNFSHPRSRHSSGETDLDLAMRADSALSTLRAKRSDFPDYESSSDSVWDSEFDTDHQDHHLFQKGSTEDEINGNQTSEKSDVFTKRKERRRERNKVSAQAYRQRRRQVNVSTQQELTLLEERNKHLLKQVHDLEYKTEQAKQFLKGQRVSVPEFLYPKISSGTLSTKPSTKVSVEPHNSNISPFDQSLSSPCVGLNAGANSNSQQWDLSKVASGNSNTNIPNVKECPLNANILQANPINLNAMGASSTAVSMSEALPSTPLMSGTTPPSVKPKQNLFNANHYYKVPIHQPKVLRTVHEIPSSLPIEEEEESLTLNNHHHVHDSARTQTQGTKAYCDELKNHNSNKNLINMNERVNSNILVKEEKIWNGPYQMSQAQTGNINDNENSIFSSKSHLQNSPPLLLHPNSFVQLIITPGDNKMASQ